MPDFSSPEIEGLPAATAEALEFGDPRVLGWLKEAEDEGDVINRADPNYDKFEEAMRTVAGDQSASGVPSRPSYLPRLTINESRRAVQAHTSTLTDLKPLFSFHTDNPAYQFSGNLINKRTVAWWVTRMIDITLGDVIKYALIGGTGDMGVEWDPYLGGFGDNQWIARDPRDTIPIRPGNSRDLQQWQGLMLREELPVNVLRARFPTKAHLFMQASPDGTLARLKGRLLSVMHQLQRPVGDTLAGLDDPVAAKPRMPQGGVVVRRAYLTDLTRNMTQKPIVMGQAGTNWAYAVQPGELLYPRKRLIVWTDTGLIFDGPNPYWHGKYPAARLTLWDLPWMRLGLSVIADTLSVQHTINDVAADLTNGIKKWIAPTVKFDRSAVSESFMKLYDPRKPNARVKLNAGYGEGFGHVDGPNPNVLGLALDWFNRLVEKHNDLTSTTNLEALLQLRQVPGADTIQKFTDAMTPQIRSEARQIEAFLRTPAEMVKVNWFQYETKQHRISVLGDAAVTLDDFDMDPDTMVPALNPGEPGYTPELDAGRSRDQRAMFFHKQFVFRVAPNSLIALNAQETKMTHFQLARMGYVDFWTLLEMLEIGNVGTPPPIPLPPLDLPDDPAEIMANLRIPGATDPTTGQQISPGLNPGGKYMLDPASGQLLELRQPMTITERLMAQQLLGIGMTVNPAGRKAAGDSAPHTEMKDGGTRPTTTESSQS